MFFEIFLSRFEQDAKVFTLTQVLDEEAPKLARLLLNGETWTAISDVEEGGARAAGFHWVIQIVSREGTVSWVTDDSHFIEE